MQSRNPAFAELGPYAVAYVDLDEGFRMMTNIVGVKIRLKDIQCGMRVKLRWEEQGEGDIVSTDVRAGQTLTDNPRSLEVKDASLSPCRMSCISMMVPLSTRVAAIITLSATPARLWC